MQHPDKNVEFTDYFGRPINAGDRIVYPIAHGSSSAELVEAKVDTVVPLVEMPGTWISTGPDSRTPTVREDQLMAGKREPTEYRVYKDDWTKAYVLVVHGKPKYAWRKDSVDAEGYAVHRTTVKNVQNVVVAPA